MSAPTPKEIRDAYSDYQAEWESIYDEGDTDMRYIAGDPWEPDDRAAREDAGRPCLSLDELNQYLNQYVNNLRETPRAIQVTPKGEGANDADGKRRQGLIRGIETASDAQGAYITAAENAASRGYGFAALRSEYKDETSFDQVLRIQRIANPNSVLINPFYKQADASDISDGFIVDPLQRADFKRRWPKARLTDFQGDVMAQKGVSDWIRERIVQVAEYWRVEHEISNLLLVAMPDGLTIIPADKFKKLVKRQFTGKGLPAPEVRREREVRSPRVKQYMTNGLEILDQTDWPGSRIPIISCFGKEIFVNEGGEAKRKLISMVRLARDAQMLFAFLATQECELAGQVPKTPYVGYVGQFESDAETWADLNKQPVAFVQADIVVDGATQTVLPLPKRETWDIPLEKYELAKDSARRSIQAAMGLMPLPTAAQRNNEKSGVALEKIQTNEQIGSFHFTDNYKRFLHNLGWQTNECLKAIYDTEREEPFVKPDGTAATINIVGATSHPIDQDGSTYDVQGLPDDHYHTGRGEFDVTIGDGPDYQSEREAQSDFVDHLIQNWQALAIPGPLANKILAKAIRMKNLGPVGDDIATFLDPPTNGPQLPPEVQAAVAQLQSQVQQLQQENSALHMDRAGRILEQQTKVQIEKMRGDIAKFEKNVDYITKIVTAQLAKQSKADATTAQIDAQRELEQLGFGHAQIDRAHDSAHEVALENVRHQNVLEQGEQAATHQAAATAQQAAIAPQPDAQNPPAAP